MDRTVVGRKIWQQKKPGQPGSQCTGLQAVEAAMAEVGLFPDAGKDGEFQLLHRERGREQKKWRGTWVEGSDGSSAPLRRQSMGAELPG